MKSKPLNKKGKKIIKTMVNHYGSKDKAQQVFDDMVKEKKITGIRRKK